MKTVCNTDSHLNNVQSQHAEALVWPSQLSPGTRCHQPVVFTGRVFPFPPRQSRCMHLFLLSAEGVTPRSDFVANASWGPSPCYHPSYRGLHLPSVSHGLGLPGPGTRLSLSRAQKITGKHIINTGHISLGLCDARAEVDSTVPRVAI